MSEEQDTFGQHTYRILVWPEAQKQFQEETGDHFQPNDIARLDPLDVIGISQKFDIQISNSRGIRTLTVSPLGRGFGQRG